MDDNFGINSSIDLYKRLLPALNCKTRELEKTGATCIKKEDIWNYLVKNKWKTVRGLELSDMVDDILNTSNEDLINNITKVKGNISNNDIEKL